MNVVKVSRAVFVAGAMIYFLLLQKPVLAETVRHEAKNFLNYAANQQTPVWCWAAVIQSILNFSNIPISQKDVVASVKGPTGLIMPSTASMYEFQKALARWDTTRNGVRYSIDFTFYINGPPPPDVLQRTLEHNRVVILGIRRQHVVVAYKAEFDRRSRNELPQLLSITYFDPWDGQSKTVSPGSREFSDISDTWVGIAVNAKDRVF